MLEKFIIVFPLLFSVGVGGGGGCTMQHVGSHFPMEDLSFQPGMKYMPPALEAQSLNYWTAREVPLRDILNTKIKLFIFGSTGS